MTDALTRIQPARAVGGERPLSRVAVVFASLAIAFAVVAVVFYDPVLPDWGNPDLEVLAPHLALADGIMFGAVVCLSVGSLVLSVLRRWSPFAVVAAAAITLALPAMALVYLHEEVFNADACAKDTCRSWAGPVIATWPDYFLFLLLSAVCSSVAVLFPRWAARVDEEWA